MNNAYDSTGQKKKKKKNPDTIRYTKDTKGKGNNKLLHKWCE